MDFTMTREDIQDIIQYCQEHGVSYKGRLTELGIPLWKFYEKKRRFIMEDKVNPQHEGEFIQLPSTGSFVPSALPAARTQNIKKRQSDISSEEDTQSYLTVEFRTANGSQMVIQGHMTAAHLREIIKGKEMSSSSSTRTGTGSSYSGRNLLDLRYIPSDWTSEDSVSRLLKADTCP